jgi:predicted enzyme related to lactoylglutathione lyase
MERVIGLGGPFLKVKDPKAMADWYQQHLGIHFNGGTYVVWPFENENGEKKEGFNIMTFFKSESNYFAPSDSKVMINFVVKDLDKLLAALKEEGVQIIGEPVDGEYGKFAWILDPEGNKIELWQAPK